MLETILPRLCPVLARALVVKNRVLRKVRECQRIDQRGPVGTSSSKQERSHSDSDSSGAESHSRPPKLARFREDGDGANHHGDLQKERGLIAPVVDRGLM